MAQVRSVIGIVSRAPVVRNPRKRRLIAAALLGVCGVLTFFPQKYRAAASVMPIDPSTLGIAGAVGGLSIGSILSNQMSIETNLELARSQYVRQAVAKRLDLGRRLDKDPVAVDRWLHKKVDVTSLRGGVVEFEVKLSDKALGLALVEAFADATRAQLAYVSRGQTSDKRRIIEELVEHAADKLSQARLAYDNFRLQTRQSSPQAALNAAGQQVPEIQEAIRATRIRLAAARRFGTDNNIEVQNLEAALAERQRQLSDTQSLTPTSQQSVSQTVQQSTKLEKLKRDLDLNQGFYDNYKRVMQNTAAEDLTAIASLRVLEPAYIDTTRQYNLVPIICGLLIFLLALTLEAYELFPPVEARKRS